MTLRPSVGPPPTNMHRRHLLQRSGALLASASATAFAGAAGLPTGFASPAALAPIRATPDRLIDISVCTRPFRPQGPRIEAEQRYGKTLVHNYGHGGSGWSLSWGSARLAVALAMSTREKHLAVVGCGAIGLTTARVAQRAGLRVRIYCKDRPPEVRSSAASGVWSPDSRICTARYATPEFTRQWEAMARSSFKTYQSLPGLPGEPVQWHDGYARSDVPFDQPASSPWRSVEPDYPDLEELLLDIRPQSLALSPGEHPFHAPFVRRYTQLVFNIASYSRMLLEDF